MSTFFIPSTVRTCSWVCRCLEVRSSQGSAVHRLGPAGPINLKLVLVRKSNMQEGNVLHKYFFQYSSLWALVEIIVCCKTDHSFLFAKSSHQLNHSLLFASRNTLQHHKIFADVWEGQLQNKSTARRPAFTPTRPAAPSVLQADGQLENPACFSRLAQLLAPQPGARMEAKETSGSFAGASI